MVGKHGVTGALRKELQQAAFAHELVKVKIASECPLDRFEVAARLGREPGVLIVQILGHMVLVYKRHPQEPKFEGKLARDPNPSPDEGADIVMAPAARPRQSPPARKTERNLPPSRPPSRRRQSSDTGRTTHAEATRAPKRQPAKRT